MKKLLVLVLAVALGVGVGTAVATAQVEPAAPEFPISKVIGTQVAQGGIGDVLLFSLYDVRELEEPGETLIPIRGAQWENYIAIENVSGLWTAFHLRFRSWKKSIEVYDHVILLSPYDVFWMTLTRATDEGFTTNPLGDGTFEKFYEGDVLMKSSDTHTLWNSGLIYENMGQTEWVGKFQPFLLDDCGFPDGGSGIPTDINEEMQVGHIEVIGLWQLWPKEKAGCNPGSSTDTIDCFLTCSIEDTHNLDEVVLDVYDDGTSTADNPTINVYDCLEALFFDIESDGDHDDDWPWGAVEIENECDYDDNPGVCDPDGSDEEESPGYENDRYGMDCANVLTGMLSMGDPVSGRYQLENFIALEDFRTNICCQPLGGLAQTVMNDLPFDSYHPGCGWSHRYYTTSAHEGIEYGIRNKTMPIWQHRDGYERGGIFFPTSIMRWWYGYGNPVNKYTGGSYQTYLWYYVNENWTVSVGPSLRDGDDLWGTNWNDVNVFDETLVKSYGSTSSALDADAQVHYFNDIWSLDDVEAALAKSEIWYPHFRTRTENPDRPNINTYVALTYPTKHYHWFFADWPFMWIADSNKPGSDSGNNEANHKLTQVDVDKYWNNVWEYRGDNAAGLKDVEDSGETIADWFYTKYKNGLVAVASQVWDMEQNSPSREPGTPPPGSPYRPGVVVDKYVPHETNLINVGEEADTSGIGLGDANFLLAAATEDDVFNIGHFLFSTSVLVNGQRGLGLAYVEPFPYVPPVVDMVSGQSEEYLKENCLLHCTETDLFCDDNGKVAAEFNGGCKEICVEGFYVCTDSGFHGIYNNPHADWYGSGYPLPPIGLVSYLHAYAGQGLITRSNMAEWHYNPETLLVAPKLLRYIDWLIAIHTQQPPNDAP